MPYIVMRRDDIPNGALQVLDLAPNTSLATSIQPGGQSKYIRRHTYDAVAVSGGATLAAYSGLAAYLIDAVADGTDGGALSATEANSLAADIMGLVDAGSALTVTAINTLLDAEITDTELAGNGSVGTVADVLKILAGGTYTVPASTAADTTAGEFKGELAGSFATAGYKHTYDGLPLRLSMGEGSLKGYLASTFTYLETDGAALTVYADDGSVLTATSA